MWKEALFDFEVYDKKFMGGDDFPVRANEHHIVYIELQFRTLSTGFSNRKRVCYVKFFKDV